MIDRNHAPDLAGPLSYPGRVAWTDGRIIVADSGHHRVLLLDEKGCVTDTIGSGLRGLREGPFAEAALDDPQGLAVRGDDLFIADTRTHSIYKADLKERTLRRIAGTGEPGGPLSARSPAVETAVRSPCDLAISGDELFVALAGSHQIAAIDLRNGNIEVVAGNGRDGLVDGKGCDAALAQPSGLAVQGEVLYVADCGSSSVRAIDLRSRKIYTVASGLSDYGDAIGPVRTGMLQHPLAVAATRSSGLLVADTGNHKIKRFSPDGLRLEPFFEGAADSRLNRPAGLAVLPDGEVLVADSNNHRLLLISRNGEKAFELVVRGAPESRRTPLAQESGAIQ